MQDLGCAGVVRGKAIWWGGQRGELKRASENAPRSKRDGDEMDRQKKKGTEERKGGKGTVISRTELNEARKGGVMERQTLMFFFVLGTAHVFWALWLAIRNNRDLQQTRNCRLLNKPP